MSKRPLWRALSILLVVAAAGCTEPRGRSGRDASIGDDASVIDVADAPAEAGSDASADADLADGTAIDAAIDAPIDGSTSGQFRTVGALAQPRLQHAAALLPDGRVLIVGGIVRDPADPNATWMSTAHAEVFDPATELFSAVAPMALPRDRPRATTLADGRVLVTGAARGPSGFVATTELFDPITNTFVAGPPTLAVHRVHTATRLADGRVLVAGESVEAYLPASGSFHPLPPLNLLSPSHEAARLANGRVLASGGPHQGSSGGGTRVDAEELDPTTSAFAITGSMATPRASHQLTALVGGRALASGGYLGLGGAIEIFATAEVYDPSTRAFSAAGMMTTSRTSHAAALLDDGRVLVTGGASDGMGKAPDNLVTTVATAELFDPSTRTFSPTGTMATPRAGHTATRLQGGRVLVVGGAAVLGGPIASPSAEVYEP